MSMEHEPGRLFATRGKKAYFIEADFSEDEAQYHFHIDPDHKMSRVFGTWSVQEIEEGIVQLYANITVDEENFNTN